MARAGKQGRPRKPVPPRMRRDPHDPAAAAMVSAIVDAAIETLDAHGLPGLTTNRVAERAGVSIGSLYQYFPNKEAIGAAVFERYLSTYVGVFARAIQAPASYGELPERVLAGFIELWRTQPQIHRYLFELQTSADMHPRIMEAIDGVTATVAGMLRFAGLPEPRASDAAFVLVHACNGVCMAVYQHGIADPTEIARMLSAMLRTYLAQLGVDTARAG